MFETGWAACRKSRFKQTVAAFCLAVLGAGPAVAQTASEITPDSLQPELQRLNGAVVFTGQTGTQAPPGSENIGITLSGVDVQGALPQMAGANAAFEARLTRGRIPVSELFDATSDLEAAYAEAGLVLSRIVLPQQSLRDGGRLKVVVVNGFIENIDTTNVPDQTRQRIDRLTGTLVNRPGLTRAELERQLLLAGDVPGTALRSALGAGQAEGAAVIVLDPEFRPVTGFIGFGNPVSDELGGFSLNMGVEVNSPFKFGETLYARVSGSPENVFDSEPRSRILAVGAVVPLGFSGLSLNAEVTRSDTTPDNDETPTKSRFERQSLRLIYPFVRSRERNITGQIALDHQEDSQDDLSADAVLYRDEITVLRFGGSMSQFHGDDAVTEAGFVLSRGIDALGARTLSDVQGGVGLSRQGADAEFTKLVASFSHRRSLSETLALSVTGRVQTSFGDPVLTSEQFSIVGAQELSAFDSGSLRGDSGFVLRSEVSMQNMVNLGDTPVMLSPYVFAGFGAVKLEDPTEEEESTTEAFSYGIGVDLFTRTESNFRSSSLRIEIGRGERDDDERDENRFSITGNFRF